MVPHMPILVLTWSYLFIVNHEKKDAAASIGTLDLEHDDLEHEHCHEIDPLDRSPPRPGSCQSFISL